MIDNYQHLIPSCDNDPKDRHVLAAAVRAYIHTIVTFNLKHFAPASLDQWNITAIHPASYLKTLYEHDNTIVLIKLSEMAAKLERTLPELLTRLGWKCGDFTAYVHQMTGIEIPIISPAEWKRN